MTYTCGYPEAGFGMDIFAYRTWDLSKKHTTLGKSFMQFPSSRSLLNDVLPAGETVKR